jgi:lysophospholipase L1-like esterase
MKLWTTLISLFAILIFQGCSKPNYKNFPPTAKGDWVAFGDSLTSGFGANEGQDYPSVLSKNLGIKIRNFGVPGNTSADGLNRVEQIAALEPRVVLLCLGGNDGLRSIPPEQMISNIGVIIDRLQQGGSFVILIGVHSASFRDKNAPYFKKLAKEKRTLYVPDILDGVLGSPSLMSDHIHPNEAGYQKIAERLEGILRPYLAGLEQ